MGSIRKAAEVLAISQPALSQALRRLEDVMEVQLFSRSRQGIKLTTQGQILLESAQRIIENIDLLESRIKKNEQEEMERLRIGTHETLAIHIWPELIEAYKLKNEKHFISIMSARISHLAQQLRNGELDLIFTVSPKVLEGMKSVKIYSDNFAFFISPKYKKIKRKAISIMDLANHPILTDNQSHLAQDRSVLRALSSFGLHSSSFFQLNSFEASIRLADKGLGIAFLPMKIAQKLQARFEIQKLTVKDMPKGHFKHDLCASYLEGNVVAENLCHFIKNKLKNS